MRSVEAVNAHLAPHRAHSITLRADGATEKCPWCGQAITRDEFNSIRERIEAEGRARVEQAERALTERFAREQARMETKKKTEIDAARRAGAKEAEHQIRVLRASQENLVAQRVQAAREGFERKLTEAVGAERTKAYAERQKLDAQLQDLQRRLQKKTANELGDEGELDLYSELSREFPTDKAERIKKGVEGGDIRLHVVHSGKVCGTILLDAKNTNRFMKKYVAKLRADQLREGADHAVLVTRAFPAGCQELAVQDGVVIAAPQRAIVLVGLLRKHVIAAYVARLSHEGRSEKAAAIYRLIVSDRFSQMLGQVRTHTDELASVDRAELVAHQRVWGRRAELIRAVAKLNQDIASEIDGIIGFGLGEHTV